MNYFDLISSKLYNMTIKVKFVYRNLPVLRITGVLFATECNDGMSVILSSADQLIILLIIWRRISVSLSWSMSVLKFTR